MKMLSKMCITTIRNVAGPCLNICGMCFKGYCKVCMNMRGAGGGGDTLPL